MTHINPRLMTYDKNYGISLLFCTFIPVHIEIKPFNRYIYDLTASTGTLNNIQIHFNKPLSMAKGSFKYLKRKL